jgi:hypothetical protein
VEFSNNLNCELNELTILIKTLGSERKVLKHEARGHVKRINKAAEELEKASNNFKSLKNKYSSAMNAVKQPGLLDLVLSKVSSTLGISNSLLMLL